MPPTSIRAEIECFARPCAVLSEQVAPNEHAWRARGYSICDLWRKAGSAVGCCCASDDEEYGGCGRLHLATEAVIIDGETGHDIALPRSASQL